MSEPTFLSDLTGSFSTPAAQNPTVALMEAAYTDAGLNVRYLNCEVPPEQLLAAVLTYRVLYEIIPVLLALALWGLFEGLARDGVLLRIFGGQARKAGVDNPTIDRIE